MAMINKALMLMIGITCAVSIIGFIPYFMGYSYGYDKEIGPTPTIFLAIASDKFILSAAVSASVSVFLLFDFSLDLLINLSKCWSYEKGSLPKLFLLLGILIPNLIFLFSVKPNKNPSLLVCTFYGLRSVFTMFGLFGHILEFGAPYFDTNYMIILHTVASMTYTLNCFSSLNIFTGETTIYILLGLFYASICIFILYCMNWFKILYQIGLDHVTPSQISCAVYIVISSIAIAIYSYLNQYYMQSKPLNENTSIDYLPAVNYLETSFIVTLYLLRVRLRTIELQYSYQEANELKAKFIRYISHEIRNPLNVIALGLDVIRKEMLFTSCSSDSIATVSDMNESCNHAIYILNGLLDLEKLEAGVIDLHRVLLPVSDIMNQTLEQFSIQSMPLFRKNSTKIIDPNIVRNKLQYIFLMVDQTKIKQCLHNLISGAILNISAKGNDIVISVGVVLEEKESMRGTHKQRRMLRISISELISNTSATCLGIIPASHSGHVLPPTLHRQTSITDEEITIIEVKNLVALHDGKLLITNNVDNTLHLHNTILSKSPKQISVISNLRLSQSAVINPEAKCGYSIILDLPIHRIETTFFDPSPIVDSPTGSPLRNRIHRKTSSGNSLIQFGKQIKNQLRASIFAIHEDNEDRADRQPNKDRSDMKNKNKSSEKSVLSVSKKKSKSKSSAREGKEDKRHEVRLSSDSGGKPRAIAGAGAADREIEIEIERNAAGKNNSIDMPDLIIDKPESKGEGADDSMVTNILLPMMSTHGIDRDKSELELEVLSDSKGKSTTAEQADSVEEFKSTSDSDSESEAMSVLIVDDVPMNRRMLRRALNSVYADITEAGDGLIAVKQVTNSKGKPEFDLILMDFQMPNMDGPTATYLIRAHGYTGPIIGVTGNAMKSDIDIFMSSGADQVLIKPVDSSAILRAVEEVNLKNAKK